MKNKIIIIAILLVQISVGNVHAQSGNHDVHFKGGELSLRKFLEKKFSEEAKKSELPGCAVSAIFAKFTIDSAGNVKSISFSSNDTLQVFRNILTSVIEATNGLWKPQIMNGKPVESKPFILPLIYEMEAGCNPPDISKKYIYKETPNGLNVALIYLLKFDDNTGNDVNQLDCILLKPLRTFSQN